MVFLNEMYWYVLIIWLWCKHNVLKCTGIFYKKEWPPWTAFINVLRNLLHYCVWLIYGRPYTFIPFVSCRLWLWRKQRLQISLKFYTTLLYFLLFGCIGELRKFRSYAGHFLQINIISTHNIVRSQRRGEGKRKMWHQLRQL